MTAAARWLARRLSAQSQLLRPMAIGRIWFSIQLLSTGSWTAQVAQGNAGYLGTRFGALGKDVLLELGAVPPAGLLLGVHLNRWWAPSLSLRPIPSRVGRPRAYFDSNALAMWTSIVKSMPRT